MRLFLRRRNYQQKQLSDRIGMVNEFGINATFNTYPVAALEFQGEETTLSGCAGTCSVQWQPPGRGLRTVKGGQRP